MKLFLSNLPIFVKIVLFTICWSLTFPSCSGKKGIEDNPTNSALVSWSSKLIMDDGEVASAYYEDRENFIEPFLSATYSGDTLTVTTLHEINGCAEIIGDIKFGKDTLYLLTKIVSDEVCTSVKFNLFEYVIVKEGIRDYFIRY